MLASRTLVHAVVTLSLVGALTGCDDRRSNTNGADNTGTGNGTAPATTTGRDSRSTTTTPQPDNTAVNERDRNSSTPTPMNQSESAEDIRITADIRKAVLGIDRLSVNGQNCKIITRAGVVTLRGPVASQEEKDMIATKAQAVTGVTSVVNELEVTKP